MGKDYYHYSYLWNSISLSMVIISPLRWSGERVHQNQEVAHLAIVISDGIFLAKRFCYY